MLVPLLLQLLGALASVPALAAPQPSPAAQALASDWVADAPDNICGLSDLRSLSDPAKVDYPRLWDATPEIKKLKKDGIDPKSAEGIALQEKATDRIRKACDDVRKDKNHCSVWKRIRHKDGRTIPDISEAVLKKFPDDQAA